MFRVQKKKKNRTISIRTMRFKHFSFVDLEAAILRDIRRVQKRAKKVKRRVQQILQYYAVTRVLMYFMFFFFFFGLAP